MSLQDSEASDFRYGTFSHSPITIGKDAVVSGLCVLAGPGASVGDGVVLPPNSSSTDPDALRRGQALRPESMRLADRPMGVMPALLALLALVLFESLMLVPATSEFMICAVGWLARHSTPLRSGTLVLMQNKHRFHHHYATAFICPSNIILQAHLRASWLLCPTHTCFRHIIPRGPPLHILQLVCDDLGPPHVHTTPFLPSSPNNTPASNTLPSPRHLCVAVGVMMLWDHLTFSTTSMQDTAAGMIACWLTPEMQRSKAQQELCQEMAYGELISIAAFAPMLLLSNLLMLPLVVAPLKWLMLGRMTGDKLASSSSLRQWTIHTFVIMQRSPHVRLATMMVQGTEAFNVFLRMIGYKVSQSRAIVARL